MFLMTEAFLKVAQPQNRSQSHIESEERKQKPIYKLSFIFLNPLYLLLKIFSGYSG